MFQAVAEIVFFVSYFITWVVGELVSVKPSSIWYDISAWAALITAVVIGLVAAKIIDKKVV